MTIRRTVQCLAALAAAMILGPAQAASIAVDTTDDELNSDGDCSLREAVRAANTDSAVDGCSNGAGDDVIILPAGTYTLSVTGSESNDASVNDLDVTENLSIIPPFGVTPDEVVIQPDDATSFGDRAFFLDGGSLELRRLTLHGFETTNGSALFSLNSDLTLIRVAVTDNTATGSNGGGAIRQRAGTLTIERSSFRGNRATSDFGEGGAIVLNSAQGAEIRDSSFLANHAGAEGGAIWTEGQPMTLDNVTIVGNTSRSDGGGLYDNGNAALQVRNTILAGNRAGGSAPDCVVAGAASGDFNLIGSTTGCAALAGSSSVTGEAPRLAPWGRYDDVISSRPPLADSPAVDAGSCTDSASGDISGQDDQRGSGQSRNADGDGDGSSGCDIGAIERQKSAMVVDAGGDSRDQNPGSGGCMDSAGECTLRAALDEANADADLDEIVVPGSVTLSRDGTGDLDIDSAVIVRGMGAARSTIDANAIDRALHVTTGGSAAVLDTAITGGSLPSGEGGGVFNEGELTLSGVSIHHNGADEGAGVGNYGSHARLRMLASTVRDNTAGTGGGGLRSRSTNTFARVVQSTFAGNDADFGTAINSYGPTGTRLESSTVVGNTGNSALDTGSGSLFVHNTVVAGNGGFSCSGVTSEGYVLSDDNSCPSGGTDQQVIDAGLGTPARSGTELVIAEPDAGSPAVDAGTCTDATGGILPARPYGGTLPQDADRSGSGTGDGSYDCDIGAAERQQLRITRGDNPPADRQIDTGATDAAVMQIRLDNESGEAIDGASPVITVSASGSGADDRDISAVRLVRDADADGELDSGDDQVGASQTFSTDDGTVTFEFANSPGGTPSDLASGDTAQYLLVYDFASQLAATSMTGTPMLAGLAGGGGATILLAAMAGPGALRRRRLLWLLPLAAAVLSFTACGGGGGGGGGSGSGPGGTQDETFTATLDGVSVQGAGSGRQLQLRTPAVEGGTVTVTE